MSIVGIKLPLILMTADITLFILVRLALIHPVLGIVHHVHKIGVVKSAICIFKAHKLLIEAGNKSTLKISMMRITETEQSYGGRCIPAG